MAAIIITDLTDAKGQPITNSKFVSLLQAGLEAEGLNNREICYGLVTTAMGMTEYRPLQRFGFADAAAAAAAKPARWTGRFFVCGNVKAAKRSYKEIDPLASTIDYLEGTVAAGRKLMEKQEGAFPGLKMGYSEGHKVFIPKDTVKAAAPAPEPTPPAPAAPALPVPEPVAPPAPVVAEPVAAEAVELNADTFRLPGAEEDSATQTEAQPEAESKELTGPFFRMAIVKKKKTYFELTEAELAEHVGAVYVQKGQGKGKRYVEVEGSNLATA